MKIIIDPLTFCVYKGNKRTTSLTKKEYQLCNLFYKRKHASREEISKKFGLQGKCVDVHLHNLRNKLSKINVEILFENEQFKMVEG